MASAPPPYSANTGGEKAGYPPATGGYAQQPPPQAGYPYQPPYAGYGTTSSGAAVVVSQPVVAMVQPFREIPVRTTCPGCQADVITTTEYQTGWMSWAACGVIILFGGILGCCLIPFCINAVKDVVHRCPNCKMQIAIWHRFS